MALAPSIVIQFPGNLSSVEDIDALRAVNSLALIGKSNILVEGGDSFGDGHGGIYVWDPASLATDDGASVIRPTDRTPLQAGRWLYIGNAQIGLPYGTLISRFSAKGDGTTSDTTAINSTAGFNGQIIASSGNYYITGNATFSGDVELTGDARFTLATGATLTFNGRIIGAGRRQIFYGDAGGVRIADMWDDNQPLWEWFGVGVAKTGAQNATALLAWNTCCRRSGGPVRTTLAPGTWTINGDLWARGISVLEVYGNKRAILKNGIFSDAAPGAFTGNAGWAQCLNYTSIFAPTMSPNPDGSPVLSRPQGVFYPKLAGNAIAGTNRMVLLAGSDASAFAAGDRVTLYGQAIDTGGYPPPVACFDHLTVESANAATGEVFTREPLEYNYSQNWPDWQSTNPDEYLFGKPRLMNLSRTGTSGQFQWGKSLLLDGIEFAASGLAVPPFVDIDGAIFLQGWDKMVVRRCKAPLVTPTVGGDLLIEDCDFGTATANQEWDRMLRSVTVRKSILRHVNAGWGITRTEFADCTLIDCGVNSRTIRGSGNTIVATPTNAGPILFFSSGGRGRRTRSGVMEDTRFINNSPNVTTLMEASGVLGTLTVASAAINGDHGEITVNCNSAQAQAILFTLEPGMLIRDFVNDLSFRVRDVSGGTFSASSSGAPMIILTDPWLVAPVAASVLSWAGTSEIELIRKSVAGNYANLVTSAPGNGVGRTRDRSLEPITEVLTMGSFLQASGSATTTRRIEYNAYTAELIVNVRKIPTSTNGLFLTIGPATGMGTAPDTAVKLNTVGVRTITRAGLGGFLTGDGPPASAAAWLDKLVGQMRFVINDSVTNTFPVYTNVSDLPDITITLRMQPDRRLM